MGRIDISELGEAGDIDHDPNGFTGGGKRGAAEGSKCLPSLRLFGTALTIARSHIGVGIDDEKPGVPIEQCVRAIFELIDLYSHNHWYAARPRENSDMAAGASAAQYQPAVTPIGGQKRGRRHIVGRDDNSGRHGLIGLT